MQVLNRCVGFPIVWWSLIAHPGDEAFSPHIQHQKVARSGWSQSAGKSRLVSVRVCSLSTHASSLTRWRWPHAVAVGHRHELILPRPAHARQTNAQASGGASRAAASASCAPRLLQLPPPDDDSRRTRRVRGQPAACGGGAHDLAVGASGGAGAVAVGRDSSHCVSLSQCQW